MMTHVVVCLLIFSMGQVSEALLACNLTEDEQSPIRLYSSDARNVQFQDLFFLNYDAKLKTTTLENDGTYVNLHIEVDGPGKRPTISGGPLAEKSEYIFEKIRFRWGQEGTAFGSDHVIDDIVYPLEAQFIHYNSKYDSSQEALAKVDGIAVLAFVFEESWTNKNYETIVFALNQVQHPGTPVSVFIPKLEDLVFGIDPTAFYFNYHGTLTPPHCFKSVTWLVFSMPLPIGEEQVETFRKVISAGGRPMGEQSRKPGNLGCRQLFFAQPTASTAATSPAVATANAAAGAGAGSGGSNSGGGSKRRRK